MKNTDKIELTVTPRTTGKHHSRSARTKSLVPAVLYGPKTESQNVLTDEIVLRKYTSRKFESTIFKIKSDDPKLNALNVLLKDIQFHPLTRRPIHLDFYALDMSSTIRVNIGIRFEGKPLGLADGGILQTIIREIEIECLPSDIPEEVVADVSNLGVNDSLHVYDLKLPEKIKVITRPELAIASVNVPQEEPVAVAAAVPAEGAAAAAPAAGGAAAPAAGAAAPAAGGDKKK